MQPRSKGFVSVRSTPVGPAVPWGLTLVLLVAGCTACPLPSSVFGSYFWERKRGQGSSSTENLCRGLASLLFFLYGWLLCFFFFSSRISPSRHQLEQICRASGGKKRGQGA